MNVESLKRWHWAIVGLLIGAGLGYGHLLTQDEALVGGPGFISQDALEIELKAPPLLGRPRIVDVAVGQGPAAGIDYVRMHRLVKGEGPNGWTYAAATFAAPRPYPMASATGGTKRTVPTVKDYLRSLAS